jgi:hypothetical protein
MVSPLLPILLKVPWYIWGICALFGGYISYILIKKLNPSLVDKIKFILKYKYFKIPLKANREVRKIIKNELICAREGTKYESFQEFLKDCPEYQLKTGSIDTTIRNIFRSFGVVYQQYVFIDPSSVKDKTAWLRRDGDTLIHEKGTYCPAWESEKEIQYFDIHDMRPLIDKTKDMDWKNQDAVADVVTAITNARSMLGLSGDNSSKLILIVVVLSAIAIIIAGAGIYMQIENQKQSVLVLEKIYNVVNQTQIIGR